MKKKFFIFAIVCLLFTAVSLISNPAFATWYHIWVEDNLVPPFGPNWIAGVNCSFTFGETYEEDETNGDGHADFEIDGFNGQWVAGLPAHVIPVDPETYWQFQDDEITDVFWVIEPPE